MAVAPDFSKMVPGFDFLQGLVKNASSAVPHLGQWVAPTLDPEELGKRIEELKTVQFWLEQNARMIATTVQALEVQRMTLTTLKTMNVQVADLAQAFKLKDPVPSPAAAAPAPAPAPAAAPASQAASRSSRASRATGQAAPSGKPSPSPSKAPTAGPGVVDPMQWWGALTQQFTQLAAQALKDGAPDAAARAAGSAASTAGSPTASPSAKGGPSRKAPRAPTGRAAKPRA